MKNLIAIDLLMVTDGLLMLEEDAKNSRFTRTMGTGQSLKASELHIENGAFAVSCSRSIMKIFDHNGNPRVVVNFHPEKNTDITLSVVRQVHEGRQIRGVASEEYRIPKETADYFITCRNTLTR